jgi:hypothetical protein
MDDINDFLAILERRESWTVNQDADLLKRCLTIVERIMSQPEQTVKIPFDSWLIFMASLPYKLSIVCLARLGETMDDVIPKLIRPQLKTNVLNESRMIMIHRCNIIVRKELQQDLFSGKELAIKKIAKSINLEGTL